MEDVVKKLLLLAAAAMSMAACADSTAPTSTSLKAPTARSSNDFECRSGYVVAYDENGNPYCAPIQQGAQTAGVIRP